MSKASGGLGDVSNRVLRELLGTRNVGRTLVNLQNGTATFDGVTEPDGIMRYDIDGVQITSADVTNEALVTLEALQKPVTGLSGYYSQPINTTVYYLWVKNAAGTDYVIQGTYSGQVLAYPFQEGSGLGDGSIPFIAVPATYAPIAVFKVVNGATAVFIPATTFWDATAVDAYASPLTVLPASVASLTNVIGGA